MGDRVILSKEFVKEQIPLTKTMKELGQVCGCGINTIRYFLIENELYKYYCETKNIKYDKTFEEAKCCVCQSKKHIKKFKDNFYCLKHYNHMYRYGHIIEKTIYDKNDIEINGDSSEIILRDKNQNIVDKCIVDTEDVEKIKQYKWYKSNGYCVTKGIDKNNEIDIANVIFNDFENKFDHISHNRIDNRKVNLRLITSHQNAMNMGMKNTNTSGVTGVQLQNTKKKWTAVITYNYKPIWLGCYESFDDAVKARIKGEIQYFKEYSPHYNPETKTVQLNYISQEDNINHYLEYNLEGELLKCS